MMLREWQNFHGLLSTILIKILSRTVFHVANGELFYSKAHSNRHSSVGERWIAFIITSAKAKCKYAKITYHRQLFSSVLQLKDRHTALCRGDGVPGLHLTSHGRGRKRIQHPTTEATKKTHTTLTNVHDKTCFCSGCHSIVLLALCAGMHSDENNFNYNRFFVLK